MEETQVWEVAIDGQVWMKLVSGYKSRSGFSYNLEIENYWDEWMVYVIWKALHYLIWNHIYFLKLCSLICHRLYKLREPNPPSHIMWTWAKLPHSLPLPPPATLIPHQKTEPSSLWEPYISCPVYLVSYDICRLGPLKTQYLFVGGKIRRGMQWKMHFHIMEIRATFKMSLQINADKKELNILESRSSYLMFMNEVELKVSSL